jgi:glycosyltransferase 2 family protein
MAYRWIALLCPIDREARPALPSLVRLFFVSTFAGTFLPASVGGDIVRAYGLSRLRVGSGQAVASVLMDRLLGVISILLVGIAGLVFARAGDLASTRAIAIPMAMATIASALAASVVFSDRAAQAAQAIAERLPIAAFRRIGGELARGTRAYDHHHGVLVNVLAGSIAVQLLRIAQAYCLGRALGLDAAFATYVTFIPLILLVMLLPVSINGIGPSQAAFVWFFARAQVSAPEAFALSVLFVALGVVGNLPGGLLYAFGSPASRDNT